MSSNMKNFDINVVNWDKNKLQKYIALLIIGYFGVKIFYGIFDKYSKKPMRQEIVDFSVMIVMGSILYLLTNMDQRTVMGHLGNINWFFFIGYLLGLNIPFIYQELTSNNDIMRNNAIQYIFYAVFIFIILIMIYLSIKSSAEQDNPLYYILYLIIIAIIIMGLIITRQKPSLFSSTKFDKNMQDILDELSRYFDTDKLVKLIDTDQFRDAVKESTKTGDTEYLIKVIKKYIDYDSVPDKDKTDVINLFISLNKPIIQKGYLNVHGTYVTFGLASIGWILSLLFMYDADEAILQRFLTAFNGFTIALFVSGVSFYGFQYILADQKEQQCFGEDECNRKNMILKNKEYTDVISSLSTLKWGLSFTIIILIIAIILFYLLKF